VRKASAISLALMMIPCAFFSIGELEEPEAQLTHAQLEHFLNQTNIESLERNKSYVCTDYANELIKQLHDNGTFSCFAFVYKQGSAGHALVAVNTTDRGVVYVDVEHDRVYSKNEVLFVNWKVHRVTSCFGRFEPEMHTCHFIGDEKRCY